MQDPTAKFFVQKDGDTGKEDTIRGALRGACDNVRQTSYKCSRMVKEDGIRFHFKMRDFCVKNDPTTMQLLLDGFAAQCCIRHVAHLGVQSLLYAHCFYDTDCCLGRVMLDVIPP